MNYTEEEVAVELMGRSTAFAVAALIKEYGEDEVARLQKEEPRKYKKIFEGLVCYYITNITEKVKNETHC